MSPDSLLLENPPLAIFDLDGTLIDSAEQIRLSMNRIRSSRGFTGLTGEDALRLIGLPGESLLEGIEASKELKASLLMEFRKDLMNHVEVGNRVFPGVEPMMRKLIEAGVAVAVATSKPQELADKVVRHSILKDYVSFVSGVDSCPPKPDPAVILKAISAFKPRAAIMVGDRIEDIQAADRASLPSIGIAQSYHSRSELLRAGALHVFDSIEDLNTSLSCLFRIFDNVGRSG